MKANVIYWLIGLGIILSFLMPSCNSSRIIDPNAVMKDSVTNYYVFKANGEKVTGIVEEKWEGPGTQDSVTHRRVLKKGVMIENNAFYADGKVFIKAYLDPQKINVTNRMEQFTPEGRLERVEEYDSIGRDMKMTVYEGNDSTEIVSYDYENYAVTITTYKNNIPRVELVCAMHGGRIGEVIKSYEFDKDGNRITPAIDKLEVLECKTGFYPIWNEETLGVRYHPIVILKMKNITDSDLYGEVVVEGTFIKNGEDVGSQGVYFQRKSRSLSSGLARQVYLICSVHCDMSAVRTSHITCKISIDGNSYKEVEIANEVLTSNMIQ